MLRVPAIRWLNTPPSLLPSFRQCWNTLDHILWGLTHSCSVLRKSKTGLKFPKYFREECGYLSALIVRWSSNHQQTLERARLLKQPRRNVSSFLEHLYFSQKIKINWEQRRPASVYDHKFLIKMLLSWESNPEPFQYQVSFSSLKVVSAFMELKLSIFSFHHWLINMWIWWQKAIKLSRQPCFSVRPDCGHRTTPLIPYCEQIKVIVKLWVSGTNCDLRLARHCADASNGC